MTLATGDVIPAPVMATSDPAPPKFVDVISYIGVVQGKMCSTYCAVAMKNNISSGNQPMDRLEVAPKQP